MPDFSCILLTGLDGATYLTFPDFTALSLYCDFLNIEPEQIYCCGGYENAIKIKD
jgi:hypothetical protein